MTRNKSLSSCYAVRQMLAFALLIAAPCQVLAWWNDAWSSRKQIAVDASITGADTATSLSNVPLLVRLHAGSFGFFNDLAPDGRDLRFVLDDGTVLKHQIEYLDLQNEVGLIWVQLPSLPGASSTESFWMYYGNPDAEADPTPPAVFDDRQALSLHFEKDGVPQDSSVHKIQIVASSAQFEPAGFIGGGARLDATSRLQLPPAPSLAVSPGEGWTFSAWLRLEEESVTGGRLLGAKDQGTGFEIRIEGRDLVASFTGRDGEMVSTSKLPLTLSRWQHVALVARAERLELFVDGESVATVPISLEGLTPLVELGAGGGEAGVAAAIDELQIATTARSADWVRFAFRSQSADHAVVGFGADESEGGAGGPNYFVIILQSLTVDGWVVIALCGVMLIISGLVMGTKGVQLRRAARENVAFLDRYRTEMSVREIPVHPASPIYHVYSAGAEELAKLTASLPAGRGLSPEALNLVRARLDAAVVRESQHLGRNMVLLTIAISGGPFLGLLGTVMGVMITFAVIAATGDVNINSIAPGISGALAATVAGLAVAIPALFGYNYLLTRIKDITADMRVFTDEFLATVSYQIASSRAGMAS